ncbi:MAG: hypothetical protein DRH26_00735 [Deltaproteobacteria bacterium]|nr:MAG: hypothetical protein DRH26_00735 [Deltaproteobacteria bacterium]
MFIFMKNVEGQPKMRELTSPLSCGTQNGNIESIPVGFTWDGSSVPWLFQGLFPRHRHPIASCRHDFRCGRAKNKADRKFADEQFKQDVTVTSWKITASVAYVGVRVGSFLGIGSNFKRSEV